MADAAELRLALVELIAAAQAAGVDPDLLVRVADLAREVLDTRRRNTRELAAHVARLERVMAHMAPGERATAIMERLGLSKSRFYRLRSPGPKRDSRVVESGQRAHAPEELR